MTSYLQGLLLSALMLPTSLLANIEIKSFDFNKSKEGGKVRVYYNGNVKETPRFSAENDAIQVFFPHSQMNRKMEKNVGLLGSQADTEIRLYPYQKSVTKLKVDLPGSLGANKTKVALSIKDGYFDVTFPYVQARKKAVPAVTKSKPKSGQKVAKKTEVKKEQATKDISRLDEKYLNKLVKDNEKEKNQKVVKDSVQIKSASPKKSFSFSNYIVKVVAFLTLVVALFYGVMAIFKKGVSKKTKLGFLSKADLIEVLSTHHIAPKKTLLLIRVHEQIFLVSDSDKGLEFMTEVENMNQLLKEGEKKLTGNNFDTSLDIESLKEDNNAVVLKENILSSAQDRVEEKKEKKVKFSDQIKKKVKDLRPLQQ